MCCVFDKSTDGTIYVKMQLSQIGSVWLLVVNQFIVFVFLWFLDFVVTGILHAMCLIIIINVFVIACAGIPVFWIHVCNKAGK